MIKEPFEAMRNLRRLLIRLFKLAPPSKTCRGRRTAALRPCTRSRSGQGNPRPGSPAQFSVPVSPGPSAACDWSVRANLASDWSADSPVGYLGGLAPVLHPQLGLSALHATDVRGHATEISPAVSRACAVQHKHRVLPVEYDFHKNSSQTLLKHLRIWELLSFFVPGY